MAPIQRQIVKAMKDRGGDVSVRELVESVASPAIPATAVKQALLPLISSDRIELTPQRKLRLRAEK